MSNNCYLLRCTAHRRAGPRRRRRRARAAAGAGRRRRPARRGHHPPALGPPPGPRRRGRRRPGAEVVAGLPDADAITEQTGVPVTRTVRQGDTVAVGDCTLEVIAPRRAHARLDRPAVRRPRPGTPHLFTGDSLFPGGVGNTFGDEAAFAQLIDEVETKVFQRLPDEHLVLPGPRQRLHARRRAAAPRRVAPAGLVTGLRRDSPGRLRPGRPPARRPPPSSAAGRARRPGRRAAGHAAAWTDTQSLQQVGVPGPPRRRNARAPHDVLVARSQRLQVEVTRARQRMTCGRRRRPERRAGCRGAPHGRQLGTRRGELWRSRQPARRNWRALIVDSCP